MRQPTKYNPATTSWPKPEYVVQETFTTDGARRMIHIYEIAMVDRRLLHRGTFSTMKEVAFAGYSKLINLSTWLQETGAKTEPLVW
jgi:hypothetical protein